MKGLCQSCRNRLYQLGGGNTSANPNEAGPLERPCVMCGRSPSGQVPESPEKEVLKKEAPETEAPRHQASDERVASGEEGRIAAQKGWGRAFDSALYYVRAGLLVLALVAIQLGLLIGIDYFSGGAGKSETTPSSVSGRYRSGAAPNLRPQKRFRSRR